MMLLRDPDTATAPVVGLCERYAPGHVREHVHGRAQIMFAEEGALTVLTQAGSWVLPSNRALWIPGGTPHALVCRKPVGLRTLYLDERTPWTKARPHVAVLQVPALVRELILAMTEAPWTYARPSPSARLARVLCERIAPVDQEPVHLPEPRDPRARKLSAIYYANPAERRTLSTLCALAGASARTLERLFMAETGLSIGAWTQQLRLMFALEHMADGMGVGDAAFSVGFENPSSFIALFRRQFGTSPGRFFSVPK
jgi:AraC-like DNA-binding protein